MSEEEIDIVISELKALRRGAGRFTGETEGLLCRLTQQNYYLGLLLSEILKEMKQSER